MPSNQNDPNTTKSTPKAAKKTAKKKSASQKESAAEAVNEIADLASSLKKTAYNAGAEVRRYLTTATKNIDEVAHDIEGNIRKEPVKSSMIALGIGLVVGLLTRRR